MSRINAKQRPELISIPEASRLLGLSVKILHREARAGSFPTYTAGGTHRRVLLADLRMWIRSTRSVPSTIEASAHAEAVVDSVLAREKDSGTLRDRHRSAIAPGQENSK